MVTYGNFLGGPGDNDTFVDFFGPKIIAEINTPLVAAVPEPASLALLGTALLGFSMILIRRRRRM